MLVFIQSGGHGGPIRIATTNHGNEDLVLSETQKGNPAPCVLLGTRPGGFATVRRMKLDFAAECPGEGQGQWWKASERLLQYIHHGVWPDNHVYIHWDRNRAAKDTDRIYEMFQRFCAGESYAQIAERLHMKAETVSNICRGKRYKDYFRREKVAHGMWRVTLDIEGYEPLSKVIEDYVRNRPMLPPLRR